MQGNIFCRLNSVPNDGVEQDFVFVELLDKRNQVFLQSLRFPELLSNISSLRLSLQKTNQIFHRLCKPNENKNQLRANRNMSCAISKYLLLTQTVRIFVIWAIFKISQSSKCSL